MIARLNALPREPRDMLFLLLVVGWILLPHLPHLPFWCSALAAGVLAWRGFLAITSRPLPNPWWVVGLLVVTLGATLVTHRTVLGRDAGVTLIVVLLCLKTLELRARRDIFVIFFLGFFTMLTNFFFSQSLPVAMAMLVALLGLLTALVNAHMPVGKPPLRHAARTAGWMTLLGAPIMALLFVLFPRMAPLWGIPGDAMSGRSGLSATMQVGTIASLVLNDSIAMRVRFDGPVPVQSDLYFRGPVLAAFDGREWRALQSRPRGRPLPLSSGNAQLEVTGNAVRYEVTLQPNNRPWLLTLDAAARPPVLAGAEAIMTSELMWVANRPVTDLMRYRAESHPVFRHGPKGGAGVLPEYLELPQDFNPRTFELAAQLQRDPRWSGGGPAALVQGAMEHLRRGNYRYTLEPGVYGQHTADEFWFDRKEGFCEHIASAFVVLMRAMNIPARLVTGYQGGQQNPVDGFWVIRQSDAHAWTEVWLPGRGWVRVDPTSAVAPGRTGTFQRLQVPAGAFAAALGTMTPNLVASLRAGWEALNNSWNQWVLNYTQSRQLDLLKNLGFDSPSWEDLSFVLLGLIILAALGGAAWTLWDRSQHDPWLRLLERVRRQLARAGLTVPVTAPPRQLATLVTARFGPRASALSDWLLKLETQRYAPRHDVSLKALQRELRHIDWPS